MKENKYDDQDFFDRYKSFPRSVNGLQAAGEWPELKKLLPDFNGKRVLDIGCGFGWHCIYAAEHGAEKVLGLDISEKMLAAAAAQTYSPAVEYRKLAMEDIDFPSDSFEAVISSLALHYTPCFSEICGKISRCLVKGGAFVFSVEHPIFSASGTQEWIYDDEGRPLHWPVDNYFRQGPRRTVFLGWEIVKYHRTAATYLNTLLEHGFSITAVNEPEPPAHLLAADPQMRDEFRRPMMLLIAATKNG